MIDYSWSEILFISAIFRDHFIEACINSNLEFICSTKTFNECTFLQSCQQWCAVRFWRVGWHPPEQSSCFTPGDVNIFIELLHHCPRYSVCCISHTRCKQRGIIYVTQWLWKWHQNPFKVINLEHNCRLCSSFLLVTYFASPVKGESDDTQSTLSNA